MTDAHRSDPDVIVLHTMRCCGFTSLERLDALIAPVAAFDVEGVILDLAARGLVRRSGGAFAGWGLTDAGRRADAEKITLELERVGARSDVQAAYDDFLPLNGRAMDVCGSWQVRTWGTPMVLNDHSDEVYDRKVLGRLATVDAAAQPVCARLAARLHRFSCYGPRLACALARAREGDVAQVTESTDSYHAVWFQLHEDLLVTLGISRGS